MSLTSEQLDALRRYLLQEMKAAVRLGYYDLTRAEREVLRAMCSCTKGGEGQDVGADAQWSGSKVRTGSREWIAIRAGMSRRQVDRLLDGYRRTPEDPHVPGLIERGLVSVLVPANKRALKPAILRVNWLVFEPDPRQEAYLLRRLVRGLPGIDKPSHEEVAPAEPKSPDSPVQNPVQVPVEVLPTYRHGVHRPLDTVSIGRAKPIDTVSREVFIEPSLVKLSLEHSASPKICVQKPTSGKSAWETLHPGLYRKLSSMISEMRRDGSRPNTFGWDPERRAAYERDLILQASRLCSPPIWPETAEKLAQEIYDDVLKHQLEKSDA